MSRTDHHSKKHGTPVQGEGHKGRALGYEYWSARLGRHGDTPGPQTKLETHRFERQEGHRALLAELADHEGTPMTDELKIIEEPAVSRHEAEQQARWDAHRRLTENLSICSFELAQQVAYVVGLARQYAEATTCTCTSPYGSCWRCLMGYGVQVLDGYQTQTERDWKAKTTRTAGQDDPPVAP